VHTTSQSFILFPSTIVKSNFAAKTLGRQGFMLGNIVENLVA
jgi:hypothetical protein